MGRYYHKVIWGVIITILLAIITLATAPTQTTPLLNASNIYNNTLANLTVYNQSTSDTDGDPVKNIIDWRVGNSSIASLNLPFEANNGSESSSTKDYSKFSNNGTVSSTTWNRTGGYDARGAYEFSGKSNSYILKASPQGLPVGNGPRTIVLWANVKEFQQDDELITWGGDGANSSAHYKSSIALKSTGAFFFWGWWADVVGTTGKSTNQWYHIAFTFNGSNATLYINSVQESTTNFILNTIPSNLSIGSGLTGSGDNFNGTIDEVMVFNRSLSLAEIRALYYNRTDLIDSQETTTGDVWQACVTPNDGTQDGAVICSAELTIVNVTNFSPTHSAPLLFSTNNVTNNTNTNLTIYNRSTSDLEGDSVKNIIDWRINNASVAVLNLPFEGGSLGGTLSVNGTTKDYSISNSSNIRFISFDTNYTVGSWNQTRQTGSSNPATGAGWNGWTLRNIISSSNISTSGSKLSISVRGPAGLGEGTNISKAFICQRLSGSTCVAGTTAQFKFSGKNGTLVAINTTSQSDTLSYFLNKSNDYLISFYYSDSSNDNIVYFDPGSGTNQYYINSDVAGSDSMGSPSTSSAIGTIILININNTAGWYSTKGYDGHGAYEFDNNYSTLIVPDSSVLRPALNFTVSTWIMPTNTTGGGRTIFDKTQSAGQNWGSYGCSLNSTGYIYCSVQNTTLNQWPVWTGSTMLNPNQWYHLVFVYHKNYYNQSDGDIYINGVREALSAYAANGYNTSFSIGYDSGDLEIGKGGKTGGGIPAYHFEGVIDEFLLYNQTLSPHQITLLYQNFTNKIISQELLTGQNWTACVTPNDGTSDGGTLCSNQVTITSIPENDISLNTTIITPTSSYQGQTLTINTTVYNLVTVNISNINVSLYIDSILINSTLISTLQTLGSQNISFQWNATPSNRTILLIADPANTISESNETNNNITTSVFVNKLVQLNLTTLTNGTELVKGGGSTYEDPGSFVDDLTFVNVTLYNPYNSSELVNGTCAFSMNGTLLGINYTDRTGNCMYSFNQTTLSTLNHTFFVNFSNLSAGFVADSTSINATRTFVIAKYETENQELNTRGAGYYSNGDAAVFAVNITKNDILYDPANLTIYVRRSSPNTLLHAYTYPTGITRSSTGVYQLIHIVNSSFGNAGIHWDIYVSDNQTINAVQQATLIPITSGSHSDVDIQPETATLNLGINNASGTTLNNTNVSVYDRGAYYLQSNNLTLTSALLSRPGTQNSTYDISYITPVGALLSIRSLNITTSNLTLTPQVIQNYTGALPSGATSISSVIAVNASTFNFTNATLAIPLGGFTNITTIYRCTTWDYTSANCTSWTSTPTSSYADFTLNATHFTFTVTSFSAYAGGNGSSENLTISSNGPVLVTRNATFNATYYNTTSHALISGANCNISFNDTNTNTTMTEYADRYETLHSFNSSGIYLYTITCMKSGFSGLSTTDNITINPLTYPGITSITTNNSLPKKNAVIFLNWTITDNENLSSTWIQIRNSSGVGNSTPQITTGTSNVGNYTYTVSDPKTTNLTFMVFVNDTDNTLNMSSSLSIIVQNTVPGIPSLNAPDNKTNYSIGIVVLNWSNVTDTDGDSISYILEISNNSAFTSFELSNTSVPETSNVTGITTTTLPNGTHYWRVLAKDTVGNSSYSSVRTFNTTTIPHSITINTPAINHTSNKLQITINLSTGRYTTLWYSLTNGSSNTTLCTNCLNGAATANLTRYGLHTLTAYANDSENTLITTSRNFTLYLDSDNNGTADSDADLGDDDGDGIVNINDTLKGNLTNLNTNIVSSVMVNGSSNLSQQFSGVLAVNLTNASTPVLLFTYNFSANQTLLLGNLSIMKQNTTETRGSILVTGLNLTSESTKTLYIDNIDTNKNGICIKDIIVTSIDDVSDDCTGSNETKLTCSAGGTTTGNYTCTSTDTWYVVTGATHTAAKETSITSSGSSGSSRGGRRTSSRGITNGLSILYPKQVNYSQPFSVTAENIGYFDLSNITLSIESLPSELNATITPQKFIILPRATSANFTVLITTLEKPLVDNFTIPFTVTSSSYTTKGNFFISKPAIVVLTPSQEETPPEVLDTPPQEEIPFTLPTMPKAQERYLGMFIIGVLAIVIIVDLTSHFRAKKHK